MWYLSLSPHIHSGDSVSKKMASVILALIPALLVAFYYYGWGMFVVTLASVASCLAIEWAIQTFLFHRPHTLLDGSALLTGLLLALNLPSNLPLWIVCLGALAAIGIAKMPFGGLGNNIFNPALVGRIFLLISFPAQMTTWPLPGFLPATYTDAQTGATLLTRLQNGGATALGDGLSPLLAGDMGGCLGIAGGFAMIAGLIYMLIKKTITWHIPCSVIAATMLFTSIMYALNPDQYASPIIHLFSGGLLLGAIFMATDYVTSPMTPAGMLFYGTGIGLLTALIRLFGDYPEGMAFAILIMNACTPLINTLFKPKHFGHNPKPFARH
jgi:electron transport complex protein RnfD